jgi:carboxylate-amine ligase
MPVRDPPFTMGIEEEYLLVDRTTRDLAPDPPEAMMRECEELCAGQVTPEFLRAQIEVGTKVCKSVGEARADLARLRSVIAQVAARHGLAPIAASTHPFATWQAQKRTPKDRYAALESDMQASARRLLICGMHIHIGIDDDNLRIDLMNQYCYFLPHLLALSCSSPFWEGENTGLQSYRLTVFDGLPRTRLPERFDSYAEFKRHIDVLVATGILEDASKVWWDLRPSSRYPTLEVRVMDLCTRLDDTISVAALSVCLMRMLFRLRKRNQRWRSYANMLIQENRWRAMRYGCDSGLIDFGLSEIVPYRKLLDELIEIVREDAEALGCVAEVEHARTIPDRGNSARRQVAVYEKALAGGASKREALQAVVDHLIAETAMPPQGGA